MVSQPKRPPKNSPADKKSDAALGTIVSLAVIIGAIATVIYTGITWKIGHDAELARQAEMQRRKAEEEEAKLRALPELEYITGSERRDADGLTVVSLRNKSPTTAAPVTLVEFVVTDLASLAAIKEVESNRIIVSANREDYLKFGGGLWRGEEYVMQCQPGIHIDPDGSPNDLKLDFNWLGFDEMAGRELKGLLVVWYERDGKTTSCKIPDVSVEVRP